MAEIKQGAAPAAAPAQAQKPARKATPRKLVIIATAATLLLGGGGAGAFIYMKQKPAGAEADKKEPSHRLPNFVDMEQFTVNLADRDPDRYMQIRFSLEVSSREAEATIKEMTPALRSEILMALGTRMAADLGTRDGKESLAKDIVEAANRSLEHTAAEKSVSAVRITQMIIQ